MLLWRLVNASKLTMPSVTWAKLTWPHCWDFVSGRRAAGRMNTTNDLAHWRWPDVGLVWWTGLMNPELHENKTENGIIPSKNRRPNKTGRVRPLLYVHAAAARDTIRHRLLQTADLHSLARASPYQQPSGFKVNSLARASPHQQPSSLKVYS
jgi:hypothetical protein